MVSGLCRRIAIRWERYRIYDRPKIDRFSAPFTWPSELRKQRGQLSLQILKKFKHNQTHHDSLKHLILLFVIAPQDFQTFRRPCFTYNRILDCFSPRLLSLCKQIVFQLSIERRESKGLTRIFKLSKSILSLSKKQNNAILSENEFLSK